MNEEQLKQFLQKLILMDLATINKDGYPHVTPVWCEYDGKQFFANTTHDRVKAKNIRRNPRVGFSIAGHNLPYGAVVGYGEAELEDDPGGQHLLKLAKKYLPPEKAEKYWDDIMKMGQRVKIKITPKWIKSWQG
jgi:PPOX class probable F420-dependent enzyme